MFTDEDSWKVVDAVFTALKIFVVKSKKSELRLRGEKRWKGIYKTFFKNAYGANFFAFTEYFAMKEYNLWVKIL